MFTFNDSLKLGDVLPITLMHDCKIFDGKAVVGFELSQRRNSGLTSFA